ncbi:HIT family protein [Microlunatus parietis]|uniref:Diadenosine tetraphosphate (Ap4A) HIT family hydrolase n=1 Tax=Microlunatus parietis TaxID=682979 RepID=A0A7Y9LG16_9ACTN|nr:HIT family protein [Microlunatus parietis]NYE74671.1 diadenosine tetraphosphate (Ap4A) HIT family hydrolase [Microlunatus parietis]
MNTTDCFACTQTAAAALPDREQVVRTEHWRVAHAFDSALAGWLVFLPTRHVTSFAELTEAAAAEVGPMLLGLSRALQKVVGCVKTYQMMFAEAEGFSHLHIHLVPRAADLAPELIGPNVFGYLKHPREEWVPTERMDELARELRAALPEE